jgi:hypothetical protein
MQARSILILIAMTAASLAAATAAYFAAVPFEDTPRVVVSTIGPIRLHFGSNYLRPGSRDGGASERLEAAALFPNFTPAGAAGDVSARSGVDERLAKTVFVAVKPADASLDPSDRPARLYARFLNPVSWSHPGGLIARGFEPGSPFEADELFFVEPEGRDFWARCPKPDQSRKTPSTCVSEYRQDGLDVEFRFSAALLSEWEKLNAGVRGLIEAARR